MGWLRILSEWVGPSGEVVGTDIDESLLAPGEGDERPEPSLPAPDHAEGVVFSVDVAQALAQVPEEFRIVLVLADVQDLPYEEIAQRDEQDQVALGQPHHVLDHQLGGDGVEERHVQTAEGNGPINAIDKALPIAIVTDIQSGWCLWRLVRSAGRGHALRDRRPSAVVV